MFTPQKTSDLHSALQRLGVGGLNEDPIPLAEGTLGPDHPSVATGFSSLAKLYRIQGGYTGAEPLYERAAEF